MCVLNNVKCVTECLYIFVSLVQSLCFVNDVLGGLNHQDSSPAACYN